MPIVILIKLRKISLPTSSKNYQTYYKKRNH